MFSFLCVSLFSLISIASYSSGASAIDTCVDKDLCGDGQIKTTKSEADAYGEAFLHLVGANKNPPSLPQTTGSDYERLLRGVLLRTQLGKYEYTYETNVPGAPFLAVDKKTGSIPIDEFPQAEWRVLVVKTLIDMVGSLNEEDLAVLMQAANNPAKVGGIFDMLMANTSFPKTLDLATEVDDLFRSSDETFCRYRLAGPNPMMIRPCSAEQLATVNLADLDDDQRTHIEEVFADGRLYVCDYSVLATLKNGRNGDYDKYSTGPISLFEMPSDDETRARQSIVPLAIQCEAWDKCNKCATAPPVFVPTDGMHWKIAKTIVNNADADYHAAIVHLGHTHLVSEVFLVATHRQLSITHPIFVLLLPHFEGTAFINDLANKKLISKGGTVDVLVSPDIVELDAYVGTQVLEILSSDFSFPALLKRRFMDEANFRASFPYRDDGMLIWDAVKQWVHDYLRLYYGSDSSASANIQADFELQAWMKELASENGGRVKWIAEKWDNSFALLVDIISSVIFTASAQHAAVNFPQKDIMAHVPSFPLGIYQPPPNKEDKLNDDDYSKYLPPLEVAFTQRLLGGLLGGVYHTTLGQYGEQYFTDAKVQWSLEAFVQNLQNCSKVIEQRNAKRVALWEDILPHAAKNWAYEYFLPKNIPQSVNI